jgi:hypothetical protein
MNGQTVTAKPARLADVLEAINTQVCGSYALRAKADRETREIIVTLYRVEGAKREQHAQAFIDYGHTQEDRQGAYHEALCTAARYIREAHAAQVAA